MRWRRNPHWFLVDRRGFHLSSSRRISSSALRAERRHIPNSPEIHWRDQENPYDLGCVVRKQCWRFLERRCGSNFVRFMDRIHEVHNIEWVISYRKCVVGGVVYNKFEHLPDLTISGQQHGSACQKQLNEMKSSNGLSMNRNLDNARNLRGIHFIDPINGEFKETFQKARWKLEIPMEAAMPCELSTTQRPNNWRSWSSAWSIIPIQCVFTGRWHSGFRYKMGPSSTICKWRTQGKCPGDVVQDENTWIQLQTVSAMYDHET